MQSIRIRHRQQALARRREAKQKHKPLEETCFSNGDTTLQLLARSRGLLCMLPAQWSMQQRQRAEILFEHYPEIETAYRYVLKIRQWFTAPKGKTTYKKAREVKLQKKSRI